MSVGEPLQFKRADAVGDSAIRIDDKVAFQKVLGMGASLEPTTCYNLSLLPEARRNEVLEQLVDPNSGIGMNVMRICIGTPDFTGDPWYSYDDMPLGESDPDLKHFSIEKDRRYILPVLKAALRKNPNLLFCATPWSPPGWMTSTSDMIGGRLLLEYQASYAQYFVRFLKAYEAEGIPIHAVTVQNEPGVDRSIERDTKWHYPSCRWTAEQERDFIKNHLGPAFAENNIKTEIWTYDHNYNTVPTHHGDDPGIDYPGLVLSDPEAARYVGGVAFHGYAGEPAGMSIFHSEFPNVPIYFTEESVYGARGAAKIAELFRNWASSYNAWVTIIDEKRGPNNGPFHCDWTCITLDRRDLSVRYRVDYFMYGQFMKFIERGARRIDSTGGPKSMTHVAFSNPDGSLVLVIVNTSRLRKRFEVQWRNLAIRSSLGGRSVATLRWKPE